MNYDAITKFDFAAGGGLRNGVLCKKITAQPATYVVE